MARKARRNVDPLAGLKAELEKFQKIVKPGIPIFREIWSELTRDVMRDAFVCHVAGGLLAGSLANKDCDLKSRSELEASAPLIANAVYAIVDGLMAERDRRDGVTRG